MTYLCNVKKVDRFDCLQPRKKMLKRESFSLTRAYSSAFFSSNQTLFIT